MDGDPVLYQHILWLFGHPETWLFLFVAAFWLFLALRFALRRRSGAERALAVIAVFAGVAATAALALAAQREASAGLWGWARPAFAALYWTGLAAMALRLIYEAWRRADRAALPFFAAAVLVGAVGVALAWVVAGRAGADSVYHDTYFVVSGLRHALSVAAFLAALGLLLSAASWASGRRMPRGLSMLALAALIGGFSVSLVPDAMLGLSGMPKRYLEYDAPTSAAWSAAPDIGAVLAMLGLLLFAAALGLGLLRGARRPQSF